MRIRNYPIVLAFLLSAACQSTVPAAESRHFDATVELAAWVELWNTYDLDGVDQLFLADPALTYFSSEREGLIRGLDAVRDHYEGFGFVSGGRAPEQELWVEDVVSASFASTAVVNGIWFFGDRSLPRDSVSRGPMTAVYVGTEQGYRIAHMHFANYPGN